MLNKGVVKKIYYSEVLHLLLDRTFTELIRFPAAFNPSTESYVI